MNGYEVDAFVEKPDVERASAYIRKGYLWNSGIFMFDSEVFMEEVKEHAPEIFEAFSRGKDTKEIYSLIGEGLSVDVGIMEKTRRAAVVPIDVGWNDLGSFDAFFDVFPKDEQNNIAGPGRILMDARNNLILSESEKAVAVIGAEDLIIVDEPDALLVCRREHSQKVKGLVGLLKENGDERTEYASCDYRPWGRYEILKQEEGKFKIKHIVVLPGKKLSLQVHHHRSEHWVVVRGTARVTVGEKIGDFQAGERNY